MFNEMMNVVKQYNFKLTEKEIKAVVNTLFDRPMIRFKVTKTELKNMIEDYGSLQKLKKTMRKEGYKIEVIK